MPPATPLARASAAVLAGGATAVLSHASAMTLWGFFKRWVMPCEITVTRDRRPAGVTVHRSITLTSREIAHHQGIRATSPARTLYDIAPRLRPRTRARVVNDALRSDYLHEAALTDLLLRFPDRPATKLLMPFVAHDGGPTRSPLEDDFLAFCERHHLPRPQTNVDIAGYLADAYFPEHRLIVELDGYDFHRDRQAFESDRNRDADTLLAGLATVRITHERIHETPAKEADRLRRILESRRASRRSTNGDGRSHG
ncbi:MAG: DUF559 domain-containing protein [Solirubrobacteraceae bacterium]